MCTPLLSTAFHRLRSRSRALLCGAVALASACSDTATAPADPSATAADHAVAAGQSAASPATAVLDFSLAQPNASGFAGTAEMPGAAALLAESFPITKTITCPAGGTAATTGTLSGTMPARGSFTLAVSMATTLTNCGVPSGGKTLLLSTTTPLAVTGSYAVTDRTPASQQTLRVQGTATLKISGSSAPAVPCPIDLTVTMASGTRTASVSGSFCGSTVTNQVSLR